MPLIAPLASAVLVWCIVGIPIGGVLLWLVGRIFRNETATLGRSLAVAAATTVVGLSLTAAGIAAGQVSPWLTGLLLLASVAVSILVVMRLLRLPTGRALLVWLMWNLFLAPFGAIAVVCMWVFLIDHYVVPTGAMAETIYGYHKDVPCPECGHVFAVNASAEVDTQPDRPRIRITQCVCPNCRAEIDFQDYGLNPDWIGGDRILCSTFGYGPLQRQQVVVFRYPVEPQRGGVKMNYIKRLIGLPGETIAIAQGDLYVHDQPRSVPTPERFFDSPYSGFAWRGETDEQRQSHEAADRLFADGKFRIIRKAPEQILAMRQLVYDNNHRGKDGTTALPRWKLADQGEPATEKPTPAGSFVLPVGSGPSWVRYSHFHSPTAETRQLITDFSGYNSGNGGFMRDNGDHWVGDLILECQVECEKPQGELRLELNKGSERYRTVFDLASGQCTVVRQRTAEKQSETLDSRAATLRRPGTNRLRFANVDSRLIVWVNDELIFGDGVEYTASGPQGPTANDLEPASIGASGTAATVSDIKLWRDTYYTTYSPGLSRGGDVSLTGEALSDPAKWDAQEELRKPTPMLMHVHPGHYLFLGDNSPASADSRSWGLVPEKDIIGPAAYRYFPPGRIGWVR